MSLFEQINDERIEGDVEGISKGKWE